MRLQASALIPSRASTGWRVFEMKKYGCKKECRPLGHLGQARQHRLRIVLWPLYSVSAYSLGLLQPV